MRKRYEPIVVVLAALSINACSTDTPGKSPENKSTASTNGAQESWPSYNRTLDGQRSSPLTQITAANVANLKPACEMQMGEKGGFQTGPVVIGDKMFVTTAHTAIVNMASIHGTVAALGNSAYAAAKHGVFGLTKNAAAEYGVQGLRINCVGPS